MKFLAALLFTGLVSAVAFSADNYSFGKIQEIQASGTGDPYAFIKRSGWNSKGGCTQGTYVGIPTDTAQGRALYATALAAYLNDQKVTVRIPSGSCTPSGKYDRTTIIKIDG